MNYILILLTTLAATTTTALIPHSTTVIAHALATAPTLTPATALALALALALTFLQHLAPINGPPSLSWLCAIQPFPMIRLCVTEGTPLNFVSMEPPHRHLMSSVSGVEGSLKCLPPLLFVTTLVLLPTSNWSIPSM